MKHIIKLEKAGKLDPKVVGIDFDGTLVKATHPVKDFDELELLDGAKEGMEELRRQGWYIVVDSCRADKGGMAKFLRSKGVPFDSIGFNPFAPADVGKDKLYAHVKLDDKVETFTSWDTAVDQINENYEYYQERLKNG